MEHVIRPELTKALRSLRLPVFASQHSTQAAVAANEGWTFDRYLLALCELELQQRQTHRVEEGCAGERHRFSAEVAHDFGVGSELFVDGEVILTQITQDESVRFE